MASLVTEGINVSTAPALTPVHVPELDGLRAVAIFLVLGCHYRGFAILLGGLPEFGWIGVDIFFALSGYLITSILLRLRNQPSAYTTFYSRRAIRILPPYVVAVGLMILAAIASGRTDLFTGRFLITQTLFLQAFPASAMTVLLHLFSHPVQTLGSTSLLRLAHRLPRGWAATQPSLRAQLSAYWSLSVEEYFYLIWAPVVIACSRRTVVWAAIAVCVAEGLLRYACGSTNSYFSAFFRFDALLYGALLAVALDWRPECLRGLLRSLHAVFAVSMCGLVIIALTLWPVVGREIRASPLFLSVGLSLISVASTALIGLLIGTSGSGWWIARLMRAKWMRDIGRISYTMYLAHIFVAALLLQCIHHFAPAANTLNLPESIVALELTIGVAALSWRLLEEPAQRWKNLRFSMRSVAGTGREARGRPLQTGSVSPSPDVSYFVSCSPAEEPEAAV